MALGTTTLQATGPGKASTREVVGLGSRTIKIAVFKFASGTTNYPANGEDISDIWTTYFKTVLAINVQQVTATAASLRLFTIDLTNKKLVIHSAIGTENTQADLSTVCDDVRLTVVGY
jgi:hypothetical protein